MTELDEAVTEAVERAAESRLNSIVAVLVAIAATCMALGNVKDGNVTQAMGQAQARMVDAWSYYQAKGTKENVAQATLDELIALEAALPAKAFDRAGITRRIADYRDQVAKYAKEKDAIKAEAEGYQRQYDGLNQHDDQFDLSEASFSVAIALLGVTALTQKRWLLGFATAFLGIGLLFGLAGFFGWSIHPDAIMSWLS